MRSERRIVDAIAMADAGMAAPSSKWAEDRAALPFETEASDGLYLHDREGLIRITDEGTDDPDRFYLPVERYMEMQRERDDYRKALGLVNAVLCEFPQRRAEEVLKAARGTIRQNSELTEADGRAMLSIIASVRGASDAR